MVLMFVFLVILCFSILFMYAAIHPDGLVIFSQANLFNTRSPNSPTVSVLGNDSHVIRKGPPGLVLPVDKWWVRLEETESPPIRIEGETIDDWARRVRVKMANETTKEAFHKQPITKSAFVSTTPRSTYYTSIRTKPPKFKDIPEYDENAITYNYKSYGTNIVKLNPKP
ncbi:hypothetical protein OUZ56_015219 [Daphnia magna]|uniref:Uncharacterized protein n=1 Tax=Daphnia magna TaxID=35525 RepID=A0ABR0AM64_9CRUS|nr:hypothetical protein OUZ56_015219 [Daphnia magna]